MSLSNTQQKKIINWSITKKEKSKRNQKKLIAASWIFPLVMFFNFYTFPDAKSVLLGGFIIMEFVIIVVFLFNKRYPYKVDSYIITEKGVSISKGKNKTFDTWDTFKKYREINYVDKRGNAPWSMKIFVKLGQERVVLHSKNLVKSILRENHYTLEIPSEKFKEVVNFLENKLPKISTRI